METMSRHTRALAFAGLAFAGLVAGHSLSYRLAAPLHGLPHPYWGSAVAAALIAALLAALAATALGLRARRWGDSAPHSSWALLAVLQVTGFIALEVGERVGAGIDAARAFTDPAVLLGLPLQLVFAWLAALLLKLFARLGEVLAAGARRHRLRAPRVLAAAPPYRRTARPAAVQPAAPRAPPVAG